MCIRDSSEHRLRIADELAGRTRREANWPLSWASNPSWRGRAPGTPSREPEALRAKHSGLQPPSS
eukprot:12595767-Alexandrium_andersonii.AAC.1